MAETSATPDGVGGAPAVDALPVVNLLQGERDATAIPRLEGPATPLVMLGTPGTTGCMVVTLQVAGANAASGTKLVELARRIEAALRQPRDTAMSTLQVGPLSLDLIERRAMRGARPIDLLPREFKLLSFMMHKPDHVFSRAELLKGVWNYRFVPETNLVDVHIGKLRRKIDAPGEVPIIRVVRRTGFMLVSDPSRAGDPKRPPAA